MSHPANRFWPTMQFCDVPHCIQDLESTLGTTYHSRENIRASSSTPRALLNRGITEQYFLSYATTTREVRHDTDLFLFKYLLDPVARSPDKSKQPELARVFIWIKLKDLAYIWTASASRNCILSVRGWMKIGCWLSGGI